MWWHLFQERFEGYLRNEAYTQMLLLRAERFAVNPDWSKIGECHLNHAQELVYKIQAQCHFPRVCKSDEYYSWINELARMLDG